MLFLKILPSVVGVSHNQTRQQWSGSWTNLGAMQIAVSTGGGRFSWGHKDEQAWWPFYKGNKEVMMKKD